MVNSLYEYEYVNYDNILVYSSLIYLFYGFVRIMF